MREALEAFSGLLLVMIFWGMITSGIGFWIGRKLLNFETFKMRKVLICAAMVCFITYFSAFLLTALPFMGAIPAFFIGLIWSFFLIKRFFRVTFNQAIGLWVIHALAQITAVVLSAELFIGGIAYLLEII